MSFNPNWSQPGQRKMKYSDFAQQEQSMLDAFAGVDSERPTQGQMQDPSVGDVQPAVKQELDELRAYKRSMIEQGANDQSLQGYLNQPIPHRQNEITPPVDDSFVPPQANRTNTGVAPSADDLGLGKMFNDFSQGDSKPEPVTQPQTSTPTPSPQENEYIERYNSVVEGQNKFIREMASFVQDRRLNQSNLTMDQVMSKVQNLSSEKLFSMIQSDESDAGLQKQTNPFMKQTPNVDPYRSVTSMPSPSAPVNTTDWFGLDEGMNQPEI